MESYSAPEITTRHNCCQGPPADRASPKAITKVKNRRRGMEDTDTDDPRYSLPEDEDKTRHKFMMDTKDESVLVGLDRDG